MWAVIRVRASCERTKSSTSNIDKTMQIATHTLLCSVRAHDLGVQRAAYAFSQCARAARARSLCAHCPREVRANRVCVCDRSPTVQGHCSLIIEG